MSADGDLARSAQDEVATLAERVAGWLDGSVHDVEIDEIFADAAARMRQAVQDRDHAVWGS